MLNRALCVTSLVLVVNIVSPAQAQSSDSETLRQILAELRAIHEDLRISQSTQFLLAEIQLQQGVVNHAIQESDNARTKLNAIHQDQKQLAVELDSAQNKLDAAVTSDQRNSILTEIDGDKSHLAALKQADRDWNSTLLDVQQRLQNAQDKLADLESTLSAVVARVSPAANDGRHR